MALRPHRQRKLITEARIERDLLRKRLKINTLRGRKVIVMILFQRDDHNLVVVVVVMVEVMWRTAVERSNCDLSYLREV